MSPPPAALSLAAPGVVGRGARRRRRRRPARASTRAAAGARGQIFKIPAPVWDVVLYVQSTRPPSASGIAGRQKWISERADCAALHPHVEHAPGVYVRLARFMVRTVSLKWEGSDSDTTLCSLGPSLRSVFQSLTTSTVDRQRSRGRQLVSSTPGVRPRPSFTLVLPRRS